MDTTEEANGTYFYHRSTNLTPGELLDIIFLEEFCNEMGIDSVSGAAILAGQPWLRTRTKPDGAIKGTSVISKYARMILKDVKTPFGIRVKTPVGVKIRTTTSLAAVIARYTPWLGWASLVTTLYRISNRTQEKYNMIVRPGDRIKWTSF